MGVVVCLLVVGWVCCVFVCGLCLFLGFVCVLFVCFGVFWFGLVCGGFGGGWGGLVFGGFALVVRVWFCVLCWLCFV
ncbi:hypothetical protein, partial [Listeria monocytogenes]|uniref:hypothetical protein n=1 Tax=Listeria monocytogenes TaxID=1639 RepID=UPI003F6673C5